MIEKKVFVCSKCGRESERKENIEKCESSHSNIEDLEITDLYHGNSIVDSFPYAIEIKDITTGRVTVYKKQYVDTKLRTVYI